MVGSRRGASWRRRQNCQKRGDVERGVTTKVRSLGGMSGAPSRILSGRALSSAKSVIDPRYARRRRDAADACRCQASL